MKVAPRNPDINYDNSPEVLEPVQYLFKVRKKWYNEINKTMKAVKR